MKLRLFISHHSKETQLARLLKTSLGADFKDFLDIFVSSDKMSIQAGSPWLDALKTALTDARFVVVLCSRNSIGRPWVNFEAGAGWIRDIPVVPLCHSGLMAIDLPIPLSTLQAVQGNQRDDLQMLYQMIAKRLDIRVPARDFAALAEAIRRLEEEQARLTDARDRIAQPRILCAASDQYAQPALGFHLDVAVLEKAFPKRVKVVRNLTAKLLRRLLTTQRFNIIQLEVAVDPRNGDLFFDPVKFPSYTPSRARPDKMSAAGFADLVVETGASLVVLNTCYSLFLAARVAPVANMVATHSAITGEAAAGWAECFYDLLADGYPLYKAYDLTCSNVADVHMALIRHHDLAVGTKRHSDHPTEHKGAV